MSFTTKTFSYKDKPKTISADVTLPQDMYNTIQAISNKYKSTTANTVRTLLYIALKNNFTPDLQYINCKKISSPPPPTLTNKKQPTNIIAIPLSKTLHTKLTKLQEHYHHPNILETIRTLIHISIQHNYNDKLHYTKAIPIQNQTKQSKTNQTTNQVIIIDQK